MGAARPRRWKLPSFHRSGGGGASSAPNSPAPSDKSSAAVPYSPARSAAWAEVEEAVPPEFVCPISGDLMADPVILPSGRTYERACLRACAELAFLPPGVEPGGADTVIPNAALKAAIGTWCARTGRDLPARPSEEAAREAVLRVMQPAAAAAAAKSVRTKRRPAAVAMASSSNSSFSPASTSSYGSSEIIAAEDEVSGRPVKEAAASPRKEAAVVQVVEAAVAAVDPLEDEVVAKVMDSDEEAVVSAAMAALREATRESAERRRALCTPRLLGALRRALLLPRHAPARVDASAALVNLSLEPANKVRIVRAGAVPALVEVLRSSPAEAREHAAGALFGLTLNEDNRAAIGVLGAVPPLLDLLASPAQPARARRDAGMALYHLSLAAVNQSKIARFPGATKALLAPMRRAAARAPTPDPGPRRRIRGPRSSPRRGAAARAAPLLSPMRRAAAQAPSTRSRCRVSPPRRRPDPGRRRPLPPCRRSDPGRRRPLPPRRTSPLLTSGFGAAAAAPPPGFGRDGGQLLRTAR